MKPTRHILMMEQCSMKYTATDKTAKEKTKSKNIKTRGIGEYGSVIYISGNSARHRTQVVSYVIMQKLSYIDYASATAIALVMLVISFLLLLFVNIVQVKQSQRTNLL